MPILIPTLIFGLWGPHQSIEAARRRVAISIGGAAKDIVFTSGATEANNIAILGIARGAVSKKRHRIITLATEHSSILEPVKSLREEHFESVIVGVGKDGLVDLKKLEATINAETLLVSVMMVNNETGVIQPMADIASICRANGAFLHSDCAQALGKIPINVVSDGLDLATFSGHKIYGPKGIGCIYVNNLKKAPIRPMFLGGGQEGGLRPGTLPVSLCVGFGIAAHLAHTEVDAFSVRAGCLEQKLWNSILKLCPDAQRNGSQMERAAGCFSIYFPGEQVNALLDGLRGIDISTGSACTVTKTRSSHVLKAMGCSEAHTDGTIRLCIGKPTTESDVDNAIKILRRYFIRK